jgi:hypothetical protein
MKYILIITAFFAITLSSCYKDNEEYLYGDVLCDTSAVSFSADILPIAQNSCSVIGCHVAGGSAPGILDSYAGIKAKVDEGKFKNRVIVLQDMPPSAPLDACQIQHITKWLNDGAPNN